MQRCPCLLVPILLTIVSKCAAAASAESLSDECEAGDIDWLGFICAGGDGDVPQFDVTGWKAENLRLDVGRFCIITG